MDVSGISLNVGKEISFEGRVELSRPGVNMFVGLVDCDYGGDI